VSKQHDVAIIGAGAAGLMAAIFAARAGREVVVLESAPKVGAKILIAGGGRCNVTHEVVHPEDFHGSNRNQIAKVLRSFEVPATIAFFYSLGVKLKREEGGKLFPTTDRARTVLDALLEAVAESGAKVETGCKVTGIEASSDGFSLTTTRGAISASVVIVATGGQSVPKTGSDGSGYGLVRGLGHSVTPTTPALVPLLLPKGHWMTALSGISAEAELRVAEANGRILGRRRGSVLMTHFGLSGPAVLDISRTWIAARAGQNGVRLEASLVPDHDFRSLDALLCADAVENGRLTLGSWLGQKLPGRLAAALIRETGLEEQSPLGRLERESRRTLVHALTALELPVVADRGFDYAEVTAGGVPLAEIDTATMRSRKCPGLYLCGEILDVDGWIGGYNFQWAWASGRLAGLSVSSSEFRVPSSEF